MRALLLKDFILTAHTALPVLPNALFVDRDGFKSAYYTQGPSDGKPLVLCHGLGANGLQFVTDATYFAAQGYRVIVPDLRGHGRSTCPHERHDDEFSIEVLAADVLAILDAENIDVADWVGNSLGGILALSLMGTNPNRLGRVVTFGTTYSLKVNAASIPIMRWGFRVFGTRIFAHLGAPSTSIFKPARDVIFAMLCDVDPDVCTRIATHLVRYDLIQNAVDFGHPILMIRGATDKQINAALRPTFKAMRRVKNFHVMKLAKAGHCANLDQPEKIRALIMDFLKP